ncbi:MAG: hypothetical protein GY870_14485 [archaeon]|nr:hypothetical protein [archaeon]
MGTSIKASAIQEWKDEQGAIALSVQVAKKCIESAGIDVNDIGILINLGLYREDNMAEPAMAALMQRGIGINVDSIKKFPPEKTTFCFDLGNSACGFLNAIQVTQALMKNDKIKYALLVSSDVHPSKKEVKDFPYTHYGAAVILENSDSDNKGFKKIMMKTSEPNGYVGVNGYVDFSKAGLNGRQTVVVEVNDDFSDKLKQFSIETIKEYVESEKIDLSKVKLIISEPTKDFGKEIAQSIGCSENSVINLYEKFGDTNTSALSIGYHIAIKEKQISNGDQIIFVGASSGLTSACGLYLV